MALLSPNWLRQAQALALKHRRRIATAAVLALGGYAVTALGIAPLMPDAAALPQRQLVESLLPSGLGEQSDALAAISLPLRRSTVTRGTDSSESLLLRLGVSDSGASAFLRTDGVARQVLQGRPGKLVQAEADEAGSLRSLVARFPAARREQSETHFTRLSIDKVEGHWQARVEVVPLEATLRMASGTIRSSLFAATDEANLPDAVAIQVAEIFSGDIDFHRQLRKGDTFSVVYESLAADGEPVPWNEAVGRVLAAEFVNSGKSYQALFFIDRQGRHGYFGPDGQSRRRAFLASPLTFSRLTSRFAMRFHPLLKTWRAHLGVDYGAPTGTPVRTVGDGVVEFAGRRNGYGNVVEIRHGGSRSTLYAHLSRIDVRRGQRIEQGQSIGAVGATGWATGPHLHFEFRVNGRHQNPLTIARTAEAVVLDAADRVRFDAASPTLLAKLEIAESLLGARAGVE